MKIKLFFLILLFIFPIVYGIECQRTMEPKDIPCTIISSWKPSDGCLKNLTIFLNTGELVQNTSWKDSTPFCNTTFNLSDQGTYIYNSSIENGVIVVESEDNMTSLGIIIFLMALNFVLFFIPFRVTLSQSKPTDFIMRNIVFILGWVVLTFNITIFITMADNAGLGITNELFLFQWFFLKAIYILMLVLFIRMMLYVPKLLKEQRIEKRMGKDEG